VELPRRYVEQATYVNGHDHHDFLIMGDIVGGSGFCTVVYVYLPPPRHRDEYGIVNVFGLMSYFPIANYATKGLWLGTLGENSA